MARNEKGAAGGDGSALEDVLLDGERPQDNPHHEKPQSETTAIAAAFARAMERKAVRG
jgi:hypothetical protein